METIAEAGRQGVPFTTGILVGIGETDDELLDSLLTIRSLSQEHGHIQEVILQRFLPKPSTPMASHPAASRERMLHLVSAARLILGSQMHVQVPPNIEVNFEEFLLSGADDLGGISPITRDRINPEAPWCGEHEIINRVSSLGLGAKPRPPVYPEYVEPEFLAPRMLERTRSWLRKLDGGRLA